MAFLRSIRTTDTDEELARLYRENNDQSALAQLFDRYLDLLYGVCLKYLKDRTEAQDATLSLYEHLHRKLKEHEVLNVKAWLHTLTRNHCLMILRKKDHKIVELGSEEVMYSEETLHLSLEKEAELKRLEACVEGLQPEQQEVIRLFYLEGKCYNEITEKTGLDWNKVRSFIQNGRRNLKICMEKQKEKAYESGQ